MTTVCRSLTTLALIICITALCVACGSAVNKDLDDARFALDKADYPSAITSATNATTAEPTNLNGFTLLSAAHSGQAGINLLNLAQVLTNTNNATTMFNAIHTELVTQLAHTGTDYTAGLTSLASAITTLTGFTGTVGNANAALQDEFFFQEGILMYIQALGLPTITAQPGTTAGSVAITQGNITAAQTTTVQNAFITGYAALANAALGIATDNAILTTMSENYCILKNVSVANGTASGISQGVLQDLTICQLNSSYAGPFAVVANCAVFTTQFDTCTGTVAPAL